MRNDDRHQPVKRTRATQECAPPGITGGVCDGRKFGGAEQEAPLPTLPFGAFPHASKNSCIGVRRTLACGSEPELHFTLNHYRCREVVGPTPAQMDSWADEESSPKPVHGRERRNKAVSEEEGSSFEVRKGVLRGLCIGLAGREPFMDSHDLRNCRGYERWHNRAMTSSPCGCRKKTEGTTQM